MGIKTKVLGALGVVVALVAMMIAAEIPAAASIRIPIMNAVFGAAGFVSIYLILWMVNQFGGK